MTLVIIVSYILARVAIAVCLAYDHLLDYAGLGRHTIQTHAPGC